MYKQGDGILTLSNKENENRIHQHIKDMRFRHDKARRKKNHKESFVQNLDTDSRSAIETYSDMATEYINEARDVAWLSELLGDWSTPIKEPKLTADGTHKTNAKGELLYRTYKKLKDMNPQLANFLANWNDFQAGRIPGNVPKAVQKAMKQAQRNTVMSIMGYTFSSMLNQTGAFINTATVTGGVKLAQGAIDLVASALPGSAKWQYMLDHSPAMTQRWGNFDVSFSKTRKGGDIYTGGGKIAKTANAVNRGMLAVAKPGMFPTSMLDMLTAATTWFAAKRKGMKLFNGDVKLADRWADHVVEKTQASATKTNISTIQRHPVGSFVTTLQTFVINQWDFLARDVFGWKNPELKTPERMKRIMRFTMGMMIANYIFEDVLGVNSVVPNPIGELIKGIKDGDDTEDIIWNVILEAAEPIPGLGSIAKYNSAPGGAAVDKAVDVLQARDDPAKAILSLGQLFFPLAGSNQARKSIRQYKAGGSTWDMISGGQYAPPKSSDSDGGRSRRSRRSRRTRSSRRTR